MPRAKVISNSTLIVGSHSSPPTQAESLRLLYRRSESPLNSSRRRFVPTPPPSLASPKHQNEQRICPEQGAPESPVIKAASRGSDPYVLYENDHAMLQVSKSLQAPVKIYILSHEQRFVLAFERKKSVLSTKLCCSLRHSC